MLGHWALLTAVTAACAWGWGHGGFCKPHRFHTAPWAWDHPTQLQLHLAVLSLAYGFLWGRKELGEIKYRWWNFLTILQSIGKRQISSDAPESNIFTWIHTFQRLVWSPSYYDLGWEGGRELLDSSGLSCQLHLQICGYVTSSLLSYITSFRIRFVLRRIWKLKTHSVTKLVSYSYYSRMLQLLFCCCSYLQILTLK